jgi:hypothetical protein
MTVNIRVLTSLRLVRRDHHILGCIYIDFCGSDVSILLFRSANSSSVTPIDGPDITTSFTLLQIVVSIKVLH